MDTLLAVVTFILDVEICIWIAYVGILVILIWFISKMIATNNLFYKARYKHKR